MSGRIHEPRLVAVAHTVEGGRIEVRAPAVGYWRGAPAKGTVLSPGTDLGELEILGVCHRLVAPPDARGMIVEVVAGPRRARVPVGWGETLCVLDPHAAGAAMEETAETESAAASGALVFRSPSSGRFYGRPSPGEPPFVAAGDEIAAGQTVALLEVMKTFNRVQYGGAGLPERARVVRVVPEDESDLSSGDPILELEPIGALRAQKSRGDRSELPGSTTGFARHPFRKLSPASPSCARGPCGRGRARRPGARPRASP